MPALSQKEIRDRATQFVHEWQGEARERAEAQSFWNDFFAVFGISRRRVASFEEPVRQLGDKRGSIDLFWKGTLLVEHKSLGESLEKAFSQALDYFPGIEEQYLPRFVLVSDFDRFRLYDLDDSSHHDFPLSDLPSKIHLFGFISGYRKQTYREEDPVNLKAAEKMGDLHDSFASAGYTGHALEILLVRLVYCLFADDTGIFPKDQFHYHVETRSREDGSDTGSLLSAIFQVLNTAAPDRQTTLDEDLQQYPYVDGSLFAEQLPIPAFDSLMRRQLLDCCSFDWAMVSPAIFGSMFQAVMDPARRRNLGAHYTSERNILKVVNSLFLDDLKAQYEAAKDSPKKLTQFQDYLSTLRFLDPACGCGNFLIVSYRELRRLEIDLLRQQRTLSRAPAHQLISDVSMLSKLDVDSMYGIELEEFPARVAEVALWLTDHQMNMEMSAEFGHTYVRLPLSRAPNILHGNALLVDWSKIVPPETLRSRSLTLFILGNPPFVGKQNRTPQQEQDMARVFSGVRSYGNLDYVTSWYIKAARLIQGSTAKAAFVSTNSITQGEQVGTLWPYLLRSGVKILFAHRTFRWSNEAPGKAAVFCVIIGFGVFESPRKYIFDYATPDADPMQVSATNINPYLIDSDDTIVISRTTPISSAPEIFFGSMPNDGGHLLFLPEEKATFAKNEPRAAKYLRRLVGSNEYINAEERWCLWLVDADPDEIRGIPGLHNRVLAVRKQRLASRREATRRLADTPHLFGEIRQPSTRYLLIPGVSSENRQFIPIGFLPPSVIATNLCSIIPNASLYHFGVLTSSMHMAWVRQVCGRLEGRYRYSNNVVYNNFPWPPEPTASQVQRVTVAAQAILDARAEFNSSSLADLYDPVSMPKELRQAHRALDAAVDACYRTKFSSELGRLSHLFMLYRRYTEPLSQAAPRPRRKKAKPPKEH